MLKERKLSFCPFKEKHVHNRIFHQIRLHYQKLSVRDKRRIKFSVMFGKVDRSWSCWPAFHPPSPAPTQAGQMTDIWGQQFDPPFFPLLRHNRALLTGFCCESPYTNPEQILCKKLKWAKVKTGHKWPLRSVKVWRMQFCCWEKNYNLSKWGGERGPSPPLPLLPTPSEILSG